MIRIGILGDIGSGKSYVAKNFGYPVFNADYQVSKLYQKNRKVYKKFKKILPDYIYEFPPSEKFPEGYQYKGERGNTAGWNAVVVAGKIIEKIGPILAINNLQAYNKF